MKVVIETRTGTRQGKRAWLALRQRLRVGRTQWAEFAIPEDEHMADVQFALECGTRACQLQNLAKDSPLYVNGRQVQQQTLVSGDLIRAGETEFLVNIQNSHDDIPATIPLVLRQSRPAPASLKYSAVSAGPLVCFTGLLADHSEKEISKLLQKRHCLYLLLQPGLSTPAVPAATVPLAAVPSKPPIAESGRATGHSSDLFPDILPEPAASTSENASWMEAVSQFEMSGYQLIGPGDSVDRLQLLTEHWCGDQLTVLFSGREPATVKKALSASTLLTLPPSQLVSKLMSADPETVPRHAFEGIDAALLPVGPNHWGVFTPASAGTAWERIGLDSAPENSCGVWGRTDNFWQSLMSGSVGLQLSGSGRSISAS